jgi:hypothetical protein
MEAPPPIHALKTSPQTRSRTKVPMHVTQFAGTASRVICVTRSEIMGLTAEVTREVRHSAD